MSISLSKEQRDFHRMAINAPATVVYVRDDQMQRMAATCKDLSATGVSLQVAEPLQEGDTIEVVIKGLNVQPLDVKAKVLRVETLANGEYLIGCAATSVR